ncbi:MAG: branched-chain amino acid ABC transporter permease [Actinomycetota bacterium]|nr:branched-chain amino acid ABC transporter permease [Actinomycetota bacterium]
MSFFLELLINGLSVGAVYALIALGFVIIFKATEVVNFAHGSLLLLGGFVISEYTRTLGFFPALLIGLTIAALGALFIERVLSLRIRTADKNTLAIMTIGFDVVLTAELIRRIGVDPRSLVDPWGADQINISGILIPETRLWALGVAVVLLSAFFLAFKYTKWGVAMRASAEDAEAATLMGIRRGRVAAVAWIVAGLLACVAVVFLVAFPTPGLDGSVVPVALKAFPAAILGGLDSTAGALVGGLIVGVAEQLTLGYSSDLAFLGRGFAEVMPYVIMIIVLLIRPSGLFGTRDVSRV